MKRSLRNFGRGPDPRQVEQVLNQAYPHEVEKARNIVDQYAGKSDTQLQSDLRRMVRQQMQQGSLTPEQMDRQIRQLEGMLTPEQKERMHAILHQLWD